MDSSTFFARFNTFIQTNWTFIRLTDNTRSIWISCVLVWFILTENRLCNQKKLILNYFWALCKWILALDIIWLGIGNAVPMISCLPCDAPEITPSIAPPNPAPAPPEDWPKVKPLNPVVLSSKLTNNSAADTSKCSSSAASNRRADVFYTEKETLIVYGECDRTLFLLHSSQLISKVDWDVIMATVGIVQKQRKERACSNS